MRDALGVNKETGLDVVQGVEDDVAARGPEVVVERPSFLILPDAAGMGLDATSRAETRHGRAGGNAFEFSHVVIPEEELPGKVGLFDGVHICEDEPTGPSFLPSSSSSPGAHGGEIFEKLASDGARPDQEEARSGEFPGCAFTEDVGLALGQRNHIRLVVVLAFFRVLLFLFRKISLQYLITIVEQKLTHGIVQATRGLEHLLGSHGAGQGLDRSKLRSTRSRKLINERFPSLFFVTRRRRRAVVILFFRHLSNQRMKSFHVSSLLFGRRGPTSVLLGWS
mmetsp:Transcript_26539/g.55435  ORF Transcript_26539/g.55435 Transcript_26539/m.55435 type:complete len:280 (-) Transcript_26539:643-1482(-)